MPDMEALEIGLEHPQILRFDRIGDRSIGYITVAEDIRLPFQPKRVYWTYYTPQDVVRGHHAHHVLQQILIAAAGRIIVKTESQQGHAERFVLDDPSNGLYLPPACWHTMEFSHNSVLLVLASEVYNEADYIRDYAVFRSGAVTESPR